MPLHLFISSVQKEFAAERAALRDFLRGDALLRRFFEPFLFEDLPAGDRRADQVHLDKVEHCDVYVGLFGNEYGLEEGRSPTHREFDLATRRHKHRLIFVKGADDRVRHPKMRALIGENLTGPLNLSAGKSPEKSPGKSPGKSRESCW